MSTPLAKLLLEDHPNPHIDAAVKRALSAGWKLHVNAAVSTWRIMVCPADACEWTVMYNPANPKKHAEKLLKRLQRCKQLGH
jgi:hypothetical protein